MFKNKNKYLILSLVVMLLVGAIGSTAYAKSESLIKEKTNIRLKDANEDILKTLNKQDIIETYRLINFEEGTDKIDKDIAQEFANLDQSPIGSTVPKFYLKNDLSALMILYKESDGTNVMKYAEKINGEWKESEKRVAGKPILDLDKIEVE